MKPLPSQLETVDFSASSEGDGTAAVVGLTLLQHPDVSRVGQVAVLFSAAVGGARQLNRLEPEFRAPGQRQGMPLASPVLSRAPVSIYTTDHGTVRIEHDGRARVELEGEPLLRAREFDLAVLERGLVIELSGCVLLLLHFVAVDPEPGPELGIVGESLGIRRVREDIRRVADLDACVLVRGESGSGKELVARAIHQQSSRSAQPYVAVNMGAIPPTVGASMLFGHARGAFTGAQNASPGFFGSAHRGTLFLDEIGETPPELQPLLLRAIREGEIQPVGEAVTRKVDVRVISATDADLEALLAKGRFSLPLLRRLEGYTIGIPPLRERRDDLARLFFRFLQRELEATEQAHKLAEPEPSKKPWLPTSLLRSLLEYRWPGNVAELETIAKRIAITNRERDRFVLDPMVEDRLRAAPAPHFDGAATERATPPPEAPGDALMRDLEKTTSGAGARRRDPASISDDEIVEAMRATQFKVGAAALALGVSRSWLNVRLESCQGIRKAKELSREQIMGAAERCAWDLNKMASELEVSPHGLKLRIKALDVG